MQLLMTMLHYKPRYLLVKSTVVAACFCDTVLHVPDDCETAQQVKLVIATII